MAVSGKNACHTGFREWGEYLPHFAALVASDGQWLESNAAWQHFSGLTAEDSRGWGWGSLVRPEERRSFLGAWIKACSAAHPEELEVQLLNPASGCYHYHLIRFQPLQPATGTASTSLVTFTDIQTLKSLEQDRIDTLQVANEHLLLESSLYHAAQESLQQTAERLNQIIQVQSALASAQLNLDEFMAQATDRILAITPATGAVIELLDGDEMVYRATSGTAAPFKGVRLKVASSLSGACVHQGEVLISHDTALDPRVDQDACQRVGARSMLVAPLIERGEAIGVLKILSDQNDAFNDGDIRNLRMMAGLIAAAIDHQISFEESERLLKERTLALAALEDEMAQRVQIEAALAASAERTRRILESANDAFVAIDSNGIITEWNQQAELTFGWQRNEAIGQRLSTLLIPPEHREAHETGLHRFVANGQGAVVNNRLELMALTKDRGEIAVELIISAIQMQSAWSFYAFLHDISERKLANEKLRFQAQYDSLTGLPNRSLFMDRLTQAMTRHRRYHHWMALLYLDVDRFKSVNDTWGHGVGDLLLKEFSRRISGLIRASDTLARLGGDEFTLVAEELICEEDAEIIAAKIIAAMHQPFEINGHVILGGTSIGIALFRDADISPQELIRQADTALYQAKAGGRNTFRTYGSL